MISHRTRETRRGRLPKMPKNIERMYKEGKCRDCAVVVTRMDFAKILGKFTKVKIQYESSSTPKTKKNEPVSPNSNARLKSNENGMVLIHRNAYSQHPVKELLGPKKSKANEPTPRQVSNILKENNRLKKTPIVKDKNSNISNYEETRLKNNSRFKQYGIIFMNPSQDNNKNDLKSKISLQDLLPNVNKSILPSEDWCIEYLPKIEEPMNDKVYDRIAAELEDLMYNEKPVEKADEKPESGESKVDDFPSIMDILNDNSSESNNIKPNDQSTSVEFKTTLESSDVEAMLLGKSDESTKEQEQPTPMDVDKLIADVVQFNAIQNSVSSQDELTKVPETVTEDIENPQSPSILDEALQKGIEEHLPLPNNHIESAQTQSSQEGTNSSDIKIEAENTNLHSDITSVPLGIKKDEENDIQSVENKPQIRTDVTHIIFKKNVEGSCHKLVTCPKNLKYSIELEGKHIELIGAPKYISSLEDLQVLLQIVDDTELKSLYILY